MRRNLNLKKEIQFQEVHEQPRNRLTIWLPHFNHNKRFRISYMNILKGLKRVNQEILLKIHSKEILI